MLELTNILGKHYDNKFFLSTDIYSNILKTKGILVFKDFISKTILNEMVIEANLLKSKSFQSSSNYNVYVGNDGSTVYLTQTYPSWANKAPWTEEQTAEFQERFRETISQDENIELSQGYEEIREIVSVELIGRLIFK